MSRHDIWTDPQLASQVLRQRRDGRQEASFRVAALRNARQVMQLDQLIHGLPGVLRIRIDTASQRAHVVWDGTRIGLPALLQAFDSLQCPAQPLELDVSSDQGMQEDRDLLKRLLVAGMFTMQVMTYALVIYLGVVDFVDFTTRDLFRWLGFLSSLPVVFYSATPFTRGAIAEWHNRTLGVNLLLATAIWVVFVASAVNTLRGTGDTYFDSITMLVFLLLVARYVEGRAQHRTAALGDAIADSMPLLAQRKRKDGSLEAIPSMALKPGDVVHVVDGATIPVDGVLHSCTIAVNESIFSGESRPVTRRRGDLLLAGSIVLDGPAEIRVERCGKKTAAARIGTLSNRMRLARERGALAGNEDIRRFVLRLLLLMLCTTVGWLVFDPSRTFPATIAVLVIACPCAFAITAPAALTRALGVLATQGVLVTDAAALDMLARIDVAVFDKTGTLTTPSIDLSGAGFQRKDIANWHRLAGILATQSAHPIARAIAKAVNPAPSERVVNAVVLPGQGITGDIDGRTFQLGRRMDGVESEDIWLSDESGPLAGLHVSETMRTDAMETLQALRGAGIRTIIASGDAPSRVAMSAALLGVAESHSRQTPKGKLALVKHLRAEGHIVLAVGDGNNDAPTLASADVSAALTTGSDLAQANADLLLLNGKLHGLIRAHQIAREVREVVLQGRRWSLAYNLCAVPFAALGLASPWLAALGMSASSLTVLLNAQRVGRHFVSEKHHL